LKLGGGKTLSESIASTCRRLRNARQDFARIAACVLGTTAFNDLSASISLPVLATRDLEWSNEIWGKKKVKFAVAMHNRTSDYTGHANCTAVSRFYGHHLYI